MGDIMRADPASLQIYFKDSGGNFIAVDEDNPLPTSGGGTTGDITIAPGDVQIGAVEIKDGATDQRAVVDGTGQLSVKDIAVIAAVDGLEAALAALDAHLVGGLVDGQIHADLTTLHADVDTLEALITATNVALGSVDGHVDGVEGLLTTQAGYLDGLEALITATNVALGSVDGHVDGIEALIAATNAALATQAGYLDGVEGKLDTLNTDLTAAGTATTNDDIAVTGAVGGVVILAANANRKMFVVQNTGANNIRVSIASNPTATHGIQLAAGESFSMAAPNCPTGAIKAIREGGTDSTCAGIEVV